jgi:putative membrane protein
MSTTLLTTFAASNDHWDGPGWWWPIFPLLWLLLIGFVVYRLSFLGRRRWREQGTRAGEARLAERYASGEIDEQEYERRLATLKRLKA